MSTTVTMTLDEVKRTPLSEEAKRRLDNAEYVDDPENPPLTEEELKNLSPAYLRHPEWYRPRKTKINIWIDTDVLEAYKAQGKGYQTRINSDLRKAVFQAAKD